MRECSNTYHSKGPDFSFLNKQDELVEILFEIHRSKLH